MKNLKNIFLLAVVALTGLSLTACSDDDLDTNPYNRSGVNIVAFGPSPILRTQEIRITGTNLTRVDKVLFPGDAVVEKSGFNSVTNKDIYVNVPDETVPGYIRLISGNDTATSITLLTFQEPIEVSSITPTSGLSAGDEITIKGDYVYNIAKVIFNSGVTVMAEDFAYTSRREIRVAVPLAAESGTIVLTDGDEWEMEWETPLEILSATISSMTPANADFGQQVTIKGTNFQTVQSVMFAGGASADFTVSDNNTTITATVPAECKSGAISLLLYSGDVLTTEEFSVPTISITNATPASDLIEGDVVTITGENFDRIKSVTLPGIQEPISDYKIEGNTLTFTVPEGMGDGDVVLTQNSNISVSVGVEMRKLSGIIWMGKKAIDTWSDNWTVQRWGDKALWAKFKEAIKEPGRLTIGYKKTGDFNLKIVYGDSWDKSFVNIKYNEWGNVIVDNPESGEYEFDITADEVQAMFGSDETGLGLIIAGTGYQLNYVKFVASSAPIVLWEGNEYMGDGTDETKNQPYILSDEGAELKAVNAQPGQVIRFWGEAKSDNWEFQVFEGHWGDNDHPYGNWKAENAEDKAQLESEGCLKFTLTQTMLDRAYTKQWWGGVFVVQGKFFTLKKVTISNL